jgi:hypothetical protein
MVAFHDRRKASYGSVDDLLPSLGLQQGDTVGKQVIDGRYVVTGRKTEEGRKFVLQEALPNGRVIERGEFNRRYQAKNATSEIKPTSVYDI